MDFISQLSTPHQSVSQENTTLAGKPQASSLKSLKQHPGNLAVGFGGQNSSRKKLSQMSNNNYKGGVAGTPGVSGRPKLGIMSNTPQGHGGGAGNAFHHLKEGTFVKPSSVKQTGGVPAKKKGLGASTNIQTLSTLCESGQKHTLSTACKDNCLNCFPLSSEEFIQEYQPFCTVGRFKFDHLSLVESDEDESKLRITPEEFYDYYN